MDVKSIEIKLAKKIIDIGDSELIGLYFAYHGCINYRLDKIEKETVVLQKKLETLEEARRKHCGGKR